jgi:hypothetical protein
VLILVTGVIFVDSQSIESACYVLIATFFSLLLLRIRSPVSSLLTVCR